jgi:hypothetical protein
MTVEGSVWGHTVPGQEREHFWTTAGFGACFAQIHSRAGSGKQATSRVWVPLPQTLAWEVSWQVFQMPSLHVNDMQAGSWHSCLSTRLGQALPKPSGCLRTVRWRVLRLFPHVFEHSWSHLPHELTTQSCVHSTRHFSQELGFFAWSQFDSGTKLRSDWSWHKTCRSLLPCPQLVALLSGRQLANGEAYQL